MMSYRKYQHNDQRDPLIEPGYFWRSLLMAAAIVAACYAILIAAALIAGAV